jgi:predicted NodU family carbamoyl transferase
LTRHTIPSVVHVNGTARVQTLTREHDPFLADVLTEFAALTGTPVLINTSLNVKDDMRRDPLRSAHAWCVTSLSFRS